MMEQHQVQVFATTVQKTNELLQDIEDYFGWNDRHAAYLALRCVLHTLRDRLPVEPAVAFGAQLPMLVRGFYYEGWKPSQVPIRMNQAQFIWEVERCMNQPVVDNAAGIIHGVLVTLANHIDPLEIAKIQKILPPDLAELVNIAV